MNNNIHSTAIIGDSVRIGSNNKILPYTVIADGVDIGNDNIIGPHVVIGASSIESIDSEPYDGRVIIGNRNVIKEFSSVQKSTGIKPTRIGDNVFLRPTSNVPHDAVIEDNVSTGPKVAIAGHSVLLEGAYIGIGSSIHQFSVIGQFSMVGANSTVVKNLKPFAKLIPGKNLGINEYNIKKYAFEAYADEIYRYVLEGKLPTSDIILAIVEKFEKLHADSNRSCY